MTNIPFSQLAQSVRFTVLTRGSALWDNDVAYIRSVAFFAARAWKRFAKSLISFKKDVFDATMIAFVAVIGAYVFFPVIANADMTVGQKPTDHKTVALMIEAMENQTREHGVLPTAERAEPVKTFTVPITAYTSDAAQTDDTPCITASGMDVCEHGIEDVIAANFLPMGTRVRIPELFGDRIFTVQDRMNKRYDKRVDVWMKEYASAKQFGLKYATIEVF